MTETGHGSDVQNLETTAIYDQDTEEFVINPRPRPRARTISAAPPRAPRSQQCSPSSSHWVTTTGCTASWFRSGMPTATTRPA